LGLDPLGAIASGALLLVVPTEECMCIQAALSGEGILCAQIGEVLDDDSPALSGHPEHPRPAAWQPGKDGPQLLPHPERDEIARLFSG
jgi:hydrogenase maturation factor